MLFSKLKHKDEELLPPPPPFPSMEFEEEKEKPKFFDEIEKPKKAETFPEEDEFKDLLKEVEALKPKKAVKKVKVKTKEVIKKPLFKKELKLKKLPIKKPEIKKQILTKPIKEKKITLKKPTKQLKLPIKKIKTKIQKPKAEFPELEELKLGPEFELPKELEEPIEKEIELPETLEDFDIEDLGKELNIEKELGFEKEFKQTEAKPKEIQEAEEEIKSAIESIKEQEKPSFFKRLFARKKEKIEEFEEKPLEMPEVSGDKVFMIQDKINKTREALMRFDLETAKKNYIEVMKIYNRISPEEQAKFYHDVRDLYFERKSAEELKV